MTFEEIVKAGAPVSLDPKRALRDLKDFLAGELSLATAFVWGWTPQGADYWADRFHKGGAHLDPEVREIVGGWINTLKEGIA